MHRNGATAANAGSEVFASFFPGGGRPRKEVTERNFIPESGPTNCPDYALMVGIFDLVQGYTRFTTTYEWILLLTTKIYLLCNIGILAYSSLCLYAISKFFCFNLLITVFTFPKYYNYSCISR
jgi:hypothetical protein